GLQPAMRVHAVRDLPVAAAGEPAGPGGGRGREGVPEAARVRPWAAARGLAVAALLLAGACAGPLRVAAGPQPGADAPPVPLLWVAERGGRSLYLLGSFHLLSPRDYPLSPDVQAAFDDAEEVLLELSPEEMASPTLAARMARAARRDDGTTLGSELPPETRR